MSRTKQGSQERLDAVAPDTGSEVELVPNAASLIESMRDFGYSLETAVADIIDNSITAKATRIDVLTFDDGNAFRLGVIDDGVGMSGEELLAAMAPGSRNPLEERSKTDLGRFGLGLKTASFSQCRCLTVVTRKSGATSVARWDLDIVQSQSRWVVQLPASAEGLPWADRIGSQGTLVLWERVDRLVKPESAIREDVRNRELNHRLVELSEHLELVFHRFLTGEPGLKKLKILLNGRSLEPFDPFNSLHPATQFLPPETVVVGRRKVVVQPFVLPHFSKVDKTTWERFAGAAGYLKNQGFYLYRQKRLIVHGTWFGLRRQMPISQLARVRLDIDNSWDPAWKIDVKKADAQLPAVVRSRLREIIEGIDTQSRRPFTARGRKMADRNRLPTWHREQAHGQITYRVNEDHPMVAALAESLNVKQRRELSQVLKFIAAALPIDTLYSDLGTDADKVSGGDVAADVLERALTESVGRLRAANLHSEEIMDIFSNVEPYRSHREQTMAILSRLLSNTEEA